MEMYLEIDTTFMLMELMTQMALSGKNGALSSMELESFVFLLFLRRLSPYQPGFIGISFKKYV